MAKHSETRVSGDRVVTIKMPQREAMAHWVQLGKLAYNERPELFWALDRYFADIGYVQPTRRT